MSLDGYLDDASSERLLLSGDADFDRVDGERARSDAILVGANTIRRDNPRLRVRSAARRAERVRRGLPEHPLRVTVTGRGDLDPSARFFGPDAGEVEGAGGAAGALVYCASPAVAKARERLGGVAEVVDAGDPVALAGVVDDLAARGVRRLLVEGGGAVLTQLLTGELADELQLAVAPVFVGDPAAPRLFDPAASGVPVPWDARQVLALGEVRPVGGVALLRYRLPRAAPGSPDGAWLRAAIELSRRCPPSQTAFSVGAIIVGADGTELARGFSREGDPHDHAEEGALRKLPPGDPRLAGATLYSSMEPCGLRKSRPLSCAALTLEAGIRRVVFASREPPVFVPGQGAAVLRAAGVTVVEVPALAGLVREINAHLLPPSASA
jgi:riboflavin-specific deaminase-like protein